MTPTRRPIVVALGGNAISRSREEGNIDQQFGHTRATAQLLAAAVDAGYQPVITHGNGPQVGSVLRRVELASSEIYPIPLDICVADTQAGMGYMIGQCLRNALHEHRLEGDVTTVVTTVEVGRTDPAFQDPDKPIGTEMDEAVARRHAERDGWNIRAVSGGKFRRIVASPKPMRIEQLATIRRLVDAGQIVICCGGGGVPVYREADGAMHGASAVIDKDRTSALLARGLDAGALVILTAVDHVYLGFGTDDAAPLKRVTVGDMKGHLDAGRFAAGSMRPKVEAAIDFVRSSRDPGAIAIIAHVNDLLPALAGNAGTRIVM